MSAPHTPGPWAVDSLGLVLDGPSSPNSRIVCDTTAGRISLEERKANALLIAAAPDMLAKLQAMLPKNVCLTNSNIRDDLNVPLDVPMGDLRAIAALIAKATGQ